jgi:CO/xanthine dehydrogenase Mo-binding subunit
MTATQERPAAEVGSPRRRKEDARLITGRTRWTDNIVLPGKHESPRSTPSRPEQPPAWSPY